MILFSQKTHVQIYGQPCLHKRQEGWFGQAKGGDKFSLNSPDFGLYSGNGSTP